MGKLNIKAGELKAADRKELEDLFEHIKGQVHTFVGYPCTGEFDFSPLLPFLDYPINNVGDPFVESTYRLSTRQIEREVLEWFAELTHFPPGEFWGYVTNGGTEGNLYGLFLARERFPSGVTYYSEDTHYSVYKNLRVLNMRHIMVKSQPSGEIDYEDLTETLRIHRDVPPIIFANIGTTMTEGVDNVGRIQEILKKLAIAECHIHCDAALGGMTFPFQDGVPMYDFRAGIDSISISGHKFIGSPIPCGIVLAKKRFVDRIARSIEYVGTLDTTITGSRNGITPLLLWYAIRRTGVEGFRQKVRQCLKNAQYAVDQFKKIGLDAWRNPWAITVVFPRPPQSVLKKWQIAVYGEKAHVIMMPSVKSSQIDELVADIAAAREEKPRAGTKIAVKNGKTSLKKEKRSKP